MDVFADVVNRGTLLHCLCVYDQFRESGGDLFGELAGGLMNQAEMRPQPGRALRFEKQVFDMRWQGT
jgi:hypothetical protein